MSRIQTFLRLPSLERRLFLQAYWRLTAVRLGLWITSLDKTRALIVRWRPSVQKQHPSLASIVRSVQTASFFVPQATCLVQAVATQAILSQYGKPSTIIIGVALEGKEQFQAHAWVDCEGRTIIGEVPAIKYQQLMQLTCGEQVQPDAPQRLE